MLGQQPNPILSSNSPKRRSWADRLAFFCCVEAQDPSRSEARIQRIESLPFACHNPTASKGILEAKRETAALIVERVKPLEDKGLLAEGVSAVAFARIWYALFLGQIELEGEHALAVNADEWLDALTILSEAAIRQEVISTSS